ncbi:hypothetical protein REPUB_Repub20aG0105700 [Reevesia pubescens]
MAAGFGSNANMGDQLNHAKEEPYSGLIACRICDSIFRSDKALLDHMELHLLLDESAARRQLLLSHLSSTPSQSTLFANHTFNQNSPELSTQQQVVQQPWLSTLQNDYASSMLPRERNPFSIGTDTCNLDLHSTAPSPISSWFRNNNMPIGTQPTLSSAPQIIFVPQPRIESFTRPFLNQLEANLLMEEMTSITEREIAGKLGEQEMLDVTLKLGRE